MVGRARSWVAGALVLLLVAGRLLAAPLIAPTQAPDSAALPAVAEGAKPGLRIAPYLQDVGSDRAVVRFETNLAQTAIVRMRAAAQAPAEAQSVTDTKQRLHELRLTGLTADTAYLVEVLLDGQVVGTCNLRTWPEKPAKVKFFVYGDTRTNPAVHTRVVAQMAQRAEGHLFALHTGDLVARGSDYKLWQREFFEPEAALLSQMPVYPVAGNHEDRSELYRAYFTLPDPEWFWQFRVGPVQVLGLGNYMGLAGADWRRTDQGKWLEPAMADAAKAGTPWRLVCAHVPVYSVGGHGKEAGDHVPVEAEMRWERDQLLPLMTQYGYQVHCSGHDHCYERGAKNHIALLTLGGGGAPLYKAGDAAQYPTLARFESTYHFADVTADDQTMRVEVIDVDGKTIDLFELVRRADGGADVRELTTTPAKPATTR